MTVFANRSVKNSYPESEAWQNPRAGITGTGNRVVTIRF